MEMPGKCCGHTLNLHIEENVGPERTCVACSCRGYEPDLCYWGHEAGCEHLVDPEEDHEAIVMAELAARDRQVAGSHYRKFKIQPWDVIDEYGLTFYAGNALKYLLRAGHKGVALEDLKKARHYLDRMIEIEEGKSDE